MRVARLVGWSLVGCAMFAGLYFVMVRLSLGQVLDDIAMEGRKATRLGPRRLSSSVLATATPAALVIGGGALVVLAQRRRSLAAAVAVALTPVGAGAAARIGKAVLPRENQLSASWVGPDNTYPSGHTAVATALVLMAVTVCVPSWRGRVAAVGAVMLALHTIAMMGTGWHRPSDVVGGMAVAVALSGVAALPVVGGWRGPTQLVASAWFDRWRSVGIVVTVALVAGLVWYLPLRLLSPVGTGETGFRSHLVLSLMSATMAVVITAVQAHLAHASDAGRSSPRACRVSPASVLREE